MSCTKIKHNLFIDKIRQNKKGMFLKSYTVFDNIQKLNTNLTSDYKVKSNNANREKLWDYI